MFADSLATDVDMPGEALSWFASDDLMVGIIFILSYWNANLHRPMTVLDPCCDFGFRIPAEAFAPFSIKIDDLSTRTDCDLVIRMCLGSNFYFDGIATPKSGVVVPTDKATWTNEFSRT